MKASDPFESLHEAYARHELRLAQEFLAGCESEPATEEPLVEGADELLSALEGIDFALLELIAESL